VINFSQGHVEIVSINRQEGGQRSRGCVFHEFVVKGAADANSREALVINQFGQRRGRLGQAVRTQTRDDIDQRGIRRFAARR